MAVKNLTVKIKLLIGLVLPCILFFEYGIIPTLGGHPYSASQHRHHYHQRQKKGSGGRVLYGSEVTPNEFPPLVRIYDNYDDQDRFKCAATIIDRNWIVTSAFCFLYEISYIPENLSDFTVVAGDHNSTVRERWEQHVKVVDVIINQNYDLIENSWSNDIALARVEPAFRFNSKVYPANLPGCNSTPPIGTKCILVGWGVTTLGTFDESDVPTKAEVTLVPPEDYCTTKSGPPISITEYPPGKRRRSMAKKGSGRPLAKHTLCSSYEDLPGPCNGDNGTPLFLQKGKGHLVLAGFVVGPSGQLQRDCGDLPFVYTDVSAFDGWIRRRLSGCGNFPQNKQYYMGNPPLSRRPDFTLFPRKI